jgi:hypothetical protein
MYPNTRREQVWMITHMIHKMQTLGYRLWLSIIETSQIRLSTNFYFIKSGLSQLSKDFNLKCQNYLTKQKSNQKSLSPDYLTQLDKIRKKHIIKVAIVKDDVYWVHENVFYKSKIIDGYIDDVNAEPIDAHSLKPSELSHLLDILDGLSD